MMKLAGLTWFFCHSMFLSLIEGWTCSQQIPTQCHASYHQDDDPLFPHQYFDTPVHFKKLLWFFEHMKTVKAIVYIWNILSFLNGFCGQMGWSLVWQMSFDLLMWHSMEIVFWLYRFKNAGNFRSMIPLAISNFVLVLSWKCRNGNEKEESYLWLWVWVSSSLEKAKHNIIEAGYLW